MTQRHKLVLLTIVILAAVLRFWRLDSVPALNADEAAIGYNAWSLIKTGLDEHGTAWPVHFQSFNDYKPGLFFYIVLPFVKIMGLTTWAVRIPGALFGVASVLAIYEFAVQLRLFDQANKNSKVGLMASLFLAISPWHIHFSRGGWEVNVATLFLIIAMWLLLNGFNSRKYLLASVAVFVAALYTYHAARIVAPSLVAVVCAVYFGQFKKQTKQFAVAAVFGLILLIPLAKDLTSGAVASRAAGVGIFADPGPLNRINEQRGEHVNLAGLSAKVLHNKPVNYALAFLDNWAAHYHGEFLFLSGDEIQRNRVPETGQMYLTDLLFVLVGLGVVLKSTQPGAKVLVSWLLVAPVAAALTFQSPHALRAHNMVVPLVILSSVGFVELLDWLRNIKPRSFGAAGLVVVLALMAWQFSRYEHMYWLHMTKELPYSSQYGVQELVDYIAANEDKYSDFVITDAYDQPYILTLFYLQYPSEQFQTDHELTARDGYGFSTVRDFGKFHFYSIKNHWEEIRAKYPGALIAGTPEEIPDAANVINEIKGSNDYTYFQLVAN